MKNTTLLVITAVILSIVLAASVSFMFILNAEIKELEEINNKSQAQVSVLNTMLSFESNNEDPSETTLTQGEYYSFIFDEEVVTILAHPREELINTQPTTDHLINPSTTKGILSMIDENGFAWVEYVYENPDTGEIEPKTTYMVKHDGVVFGAGFYHQ